MKTTRAAALVALLAGCSQPPARHSQQGHAADIARADKPQPPPAKPVLSTPSHTEAPSLPEPKGTIDPDSVEAAGKVVQRYGALLGEGRFADSAKLWGSADSAARFGLQLKRYPKVHLKIGDLGQTDGAAGSIYTTVPVVFYGSGYQRPAAIILRRVNDVPGSTAEQRRWHIDRIDWTSAS